MIFIKTGLVLAGGGVKGAYQVGAFLAFKKCHIKIDGVVGTSIGAFNAAMIAAHQEKELYNFWKNVDVGLLLGFGKKYIDSVNEHNHWQEFLYGLEEATLTIKNKGINPQNIKDTLDNLIDEKKLRKSKMDFGLVTVRAKDLKPLYLFKEDMQKGKITEYILASCNLPVFKMQKYIDDNYYLDGGFYDNNPVNMLIRKNYDRIYSIDVGGIGFNKKVLDKKKVIQLEPSKFLGGTLSVNKKKINDNIKLGYYDTLKVLKKLDGYNYIFQNKRDFWYNVLGKRVSQKLRKKVENYFQTGSNKELIIKSLEYIMVKEDFSYYNIYKINKLIKYIKKNTVNQNFVYEFIRNL